MEFTIKVSDKHLDIIGVALGNRPYAEVFEVIADIQRQVDAQQKPAKSPVLDTQV